MSDFGTKAYNIKKLSTFNIDAIVLDMYIFNVADWQRNENKCIDEICKIFNCNVIIRSSVYGEDSLRGNTAGKYRSEMNVALKYDDLKIAIEKVIDSYEGMCGEVLVQPYLANTRKSGVIFTYDINRQLPYYVIEVSETHNTSAVTAGFSNNNRIYRIAREAELYNELGYLIHVSRQIEKVYNSEFLDIEFALDEVGNVVIFQVRQLYYSGVQKKIGKIQRPGLKDVQLNDLKFDSNYSGTVSLLSNMTDWNPAELVGKHPYPLDYSLYNHTFTKDTWLIGRERIGYKRNYLSSLTQLINGYAYVNVQKDFNSYLPKGLNSEIESKLVDFYIKELSLRKEMYDKAEFEIVDTCYTVTTNKTKYETVLSEEECNCFFTCLKTITNNVVLDKEGKIKKSISEFEIKQEEFHTFRGLDYDLRYIREYGIIYSSIVRSAFVAYEELLALNSVGLLSDIEKDAVMNSIYSITSEQMSDIKDYKSGKCNKEELINKYRHIREEMFNIISKSKYECESFYDNLHIKRVGSVYDVKKIDIKMEKRINCLLRKNGLEFTIQELITCVRKMFEYREKVKYQVAIVLTEIYREIEDIAKRIDISIEDIRYVTIEDIIHRRDILKETIYGSKQIYLQQKMCIFPDIIRSRDDFYVVEKMDNKPNYITRGVVEAKIICLDNFCGSLSELKNKIVLIERADPGFDWIFGMGIVGVVTCYGGVASHMAIRSYEMSVPAIIGCGEEIYAKIKQSSRIIINCQEESYICS